MRLTDLDPEFLRLATELADPHIGRKQPDGTIQWGGFPIRTHHRVDTIADAQGVAFLCSKCYAANGGPAGTHRVICWSRSRGVPESEPPLPGRWRLDGTGLHDLTLNAEPGQSRSVLLLGGCGWHGFVTAGEVT